MEKNITNRRLGFLLCAVLTGCTWVRNITRPRFSRPRPSKKRRPPARQRTHPAPGNQDNGNWTVAQPADAKIRGDWWAIFNEPELNDLESQLNIDNQNIKLYFENFMEARALVGEARALYFPTVSFGPSYNRQRSSSNLGATSTSGQPGKNLADLLLAGGGFLDPGSLWQNPQPGAHAAQYSAQVSAADLENERLVEQADLAEFYFEIRGQDALIDLFTQTVAAISEVSGFDPGPIRHRRRRSDLGGRGADHPAVGPGFADQPGHFAGAV